MNRSIGILLIALVAFMSFVGAAVANDDVEEPEGSYTTPMIVVDEEAGTITIALPVDGTLPECGDDGGDPSEPAGDADVDGDEGDDDEPESYGPGDCIDLILDHPSGKTHHGAVVSTVAKSLHPSTLDGIKKGEIMRWVAKGGGDDGGEEPTAKPEKPEKREKPEKPEKPERPEKPDNSDKPGNKDNPGNGNGNGRDNPGKGKGPKR